MVKHIIEVDGRRKDVTYSWSSDPRMFGKVSYIEGTRTYDTGRFATTSSLPITWVFTDAANTKHFVTIERPDDQLTVVFPVSSQILWHGDERDRTGLDAQTSVAKATFSYQESSFFHSHGIRVEVEGYKLDDMGYYASDTESWKSAVDMVVKGTEGVKNLAEAVAAVKGAKK